DKWVARLLSDRSQLLPAFELYAGDHWSIVRTLRTIAVDVGLKAEIWVCSAGYGLVRTASCLKPYAATFSSRHPDGVPSRLDDPVGADVVQHWWAHLAKWEGPEPGMPRTIADLARTNPRAPMLVAGSPSYLNAIAADLSQAANALASEDLLS